MQYIGAVLVRYVSKPVCVLSLCRSERISVRLTHSWLAPYSLTLSFTQWRMRQPWRGERWTPSLLLPPSPPPSSSKSVSDTRKQHTVWINEFNYHHFEFRKASWMVCERRHQNAVPNWSMFWGNVKYFCLGASVSYYWNEMLRDGMVNHTND